VRTKQKAGEFIGAFASYGYRKSLADKNRLIVDAYAAEVVRRIFKLYIQGCGKLRIAAILNEEGIVCPSEYKKINGENYRNARRLNSTSYWTYSTINRILQNEMYIGNMVQGRKHQQMRSRARTAERGEWIVVQGTHEAIIDIDTWEKTQELLKRRTRNVDLHRNTAVLAGFLKCGDCGRALVKKACQPEHNGKKGASGVSYYCGTYVRSGRQYCTPHKIRYETLESIILDDIKIVLQSMDNLKELAAEGKTGSAAAPDGREADKMKMQAELEKVRNLKKAIYEDYREELISKEEFICYRQDYCKREELLQKQLVCIGEKMNRIEADVLDNVWIQHLLQYGEMEKLDRAVAVEMLHEIKVYE
ncbi:MAG: recombinase family protein, partial [Lachnospiraceae bacterium]|nr:recombinase family protein [Lachnospiraceae bacterium]